MNYLTLHHGSFYFQMRVPVAHRERFGKLLRTNLQTKEAAVARALAYGMASHWLARFSGLESSIPALPSLPQATESTLGSSTTSTHVPKESMALPVNESRRAIALSADQTMFCLFEYWRDLSPSRLMRSVAEFELTAASFDKVVGVPVEQLTRSDIAAYRDHLISTGLAPATIIKRLGHLSAVLQTAVDAGKLANNVSRRMPVPRSDTTLSRLPFSEEHLATIFASSIYTANRREIAGAGEASVWIPVLGLLTGARLEELCQLRVRDIVLDRKYGALISITGDGIITRVKTKSSNRTIPVHPELQRVGFLRYVDARRVANDDWLFPLLRADRFGNRSGNFSRWWGRHMRAKNGCGIEDGRLVFHSFRHTFKTLCRAARIPEDIHDALTGHSGGGNVGRGYGLIPTELLVEAIGNIRVPIVLPIIEP
ncbi:tyrosine-type recombinase/integrase [Roseateles albus]|uniref:tyrosine-type recombinase/integrase n=1 Tax=Roseateles albus TaxID=2987525 RepID=UPI00396481CC